MRLYGIDAPEMPGACRPGRACTPGDPYAARDELKRLTRGHTVNCTQMDVDDYGRRVVRCTAGKADLSCAMVASGRAVERYGRLDCPIAVRAPGFARTFGVAGTADLRPNQLPVQIASRFSWRWFGLWLLIANIAAWVAFAVDKRRAIRAEVRKTSRIPEWLLLGLAFFGGSIGAIAAQRHFRHKTRKQPFANRLLIIAGLHLGIGAGALALLV